MPTTLKDIAKALGVTPVTVSKVLRGEGAISAKTRERVLAKAAEMSYRPHGLAQSMRSGRTSMIGLIYTAEGVMGNLPQDLIVTIQRTLAANQYDLLMGELPQHLLASSGSVSAVMNRWMAEGLLINHQLQLPADIDSRVNTQQLPAIWMNTRHAQNCVYFDDFGAFRRATDFLLSLGHRRIAYADYSHGSATLQAPEHYSVTDRYEGYRTAMNQAGLEPRVLMHAHAHTPGSERVRFSRSWLESVDSPTAVICYGPTTTLPVCFALASLNRALGRDVSVIHLASSMDPVNDVRLTTIQQSYSRLGELAVAQLIRRLRSDGKHGHAPLPPQEVAMDLIHGESCAPPVER